MTPPLWQKVKRNLKASWWKWKRRAKSCLKAQHSENEDHGIWSITSWHIDVETMETVADFIFLGSKITVDGDCNHEIKRRLLLGRKVVTNLDSILKSTDITLPTKAHVIKTMVFLVVMYGCELDYKESWALKTWCFWTVVLEKTLESPLDCKEIQPVQPKGDQSWVFIGRTDVEVEPPILWPPYSKSWLIGKDSEVGKDWRAGGEGDDRGWDGWMTSPTQWTWVWLDCGTTLVMDKEAWCAAVHGVNMQFSPSRLSNWTELN